MQLPGEAPIVAILRGVSPGEVLEVAEALVEAGVRTIEVPLNSPDPFASIALLSQRFGVACLCGAGTVLSAQAVEQAQAAGARLIVTPNTDAAVIGRAVALGLVVVPGFATASEAFAGIAAGARALKLFPAATYGVGHLAAVREVLPAKIALLAVGGVGAGGLAPWMAAGVAGFGIGGGLYRPGRPAAEVGRRAAALVAEYRAAVGG